MIFPYPAPQRDPRRSHRAEQVRRLRRRGIPAVPDVPPEPELYVPSVELIQGLMELGTEARMRTLRLIASSQGEERATAVVQALTAEIQKRRNA